MDDPILDKDLLSKEPRINDDLAMLVCVLCLNYVRDYMFETYLYVKDIGISLTSILAIDVITSAIMLAFLIIASIRMVYHAIDK